MIRIASSPEHTKRLKYVVSLRRTRAEGVDSERTYVGLENIESATGRLIGITSDTGVDADATIVGEVGESMSGTFEIGDVLFGKLRPYLAKVWVAEFAGRSTTELLVMEPRDVEASFLRYVCLNVEFVDAVNASTFGSKMPRADWDFIGNMLIPVPAPATQRLIANYLDQETVRIDALIAAKQRQLDLLAEKRKALVASALTRGLDPTVPMRDSGVPWLGDVPAHWKIKRSRWLFRERDCRSETGDEEMLTVSHITGVTPRSEKDVNMFEAESNEGYKICFLGDLVINTLWAWMGAMGVAPMKGIVSPAYNVYEPGPQLDPAYVDALVRLPVFVQEVTRYSKGVWSSRLRLYPEGFFETYLPVPSLEEQREIFRFINSESINIDALVLATARTINLLKERRTALISDAVTGKLQVA